MSNKQTAVEWLVSQILVEYSTFFNEEGDLVDKPINHFFNAYQGSVDLIKYVQQAKEMEKEQIVNAYATAIIKENNSDYIGMNEETSGEIYYNETFGGKDEQ
jgi:hypothetical protein